MNAETAFAAFADKLVGQSISHLWRGFGSAIFVEIGRLTPRTRSRGAPGNPQGQATLGVEWSWRIEDETSILCGSWSEEELWECAFDRLRGATINRCNLFGRLPELELLTSSGVQLTTFSTADGQPQWHLLDRDADPSCAFAVSAGKLRLSHGD